MKKSSYKHPSIMRIKSLIDAGAIYRSHSVKSAVADRYCVKVAVRTIPCAPVQSARDKWATSPIMSKIRRAQAQASYKSRLIASITSRIRTLNKPPRTLSRESVAEFLSARDQIKNEISSYRAASIKSRAELISLDLILPMLDVVSRDAEYAGVRVVRRGDDWQIKPVRRESCYEHAAGETTWKNGRPVSYERATNDTLIESYAAVYGSTARQMYCGRVLTHRPPQGYKFEIDAQGLKLVSRDDADDDYHMTARELYLSHGTDYQSLIAEIDKNRERRAQLRAVALADAADADGVYVCAADSLRAGNCKAGTQNWITQRHLSTTKHYKAAEILRLIDSQRAALVIASAIRRHKTEMRQGYADLSKHSW
jgi:hypothetical protein